MAEQQRSAHSCISIRFRPVTSHKPLKTEKYSNYFVNLRIRQFSILFCILLNFVMNFHRTNSCKKTMLCSGGPKTAPLPFGAKAEASAWQIRVLRDSKKERAWQN